ncbi:putative periplasmic lipoprotein [Aeromonas eucrenophila]|uniref:Lipoprotein n=1 Tax=Aeromonas eucrenophila TaxID=649 RepID=A0ABW0Y8L6_9GAMM|nr:lipoprotein [Aeromonas eucrenophila]
MQRHLMVLGAVLVLSACSSTPNSEYMKEGASEAQRTDALSECQYQVKLNKIEEEQQEELINLCMQGKGFRLTAIE